jgi:hypothetical protein
MRVRARASIARGELLVSPLKHARGLPRSCPQNYEGHGAPRGAPCNCFASGTACEAMLLPESASPHGAPSAAILGEGSVLPGADGRTLIQRISPPSSAPPSSRERQSHVVGPDADPSLPDATGANRARRRRILLRFKAPSRSAPHEQDVTNIRAVQSAGIAVPITKCFGTRSPDEVKRNPGRTVSVAPDCAALHPGYACCSLSRDRKPVMDSRVCAKRRIPE